MSLPNTSGKQAGKAVIEPAKVLQDCGLRNNGRPGEANPNTKMNKSRIK